MKGMQFTIKVRVWLYNGGRPLHFITINKDISSEIKKYETWPPRGFGSIPVQAKIGKTQWKTSIFWEKKGTYILPIKKEIREKEDIKNRSEVKLFLQLIN